MNEINTIIDNLCNKLNVAANELIPEFARLNITKGFIQKSMTSAPTENAERMVKYEINRCT